MVNPNYHLIWPLWVTSSSADGKDLLCFYKYYSPDKIARVLGILTFTFKICNFLLLQFWTSWILYFLRSLILGAFSNRAPKTYTFPSFFFILHCKSRESVQLCAIRRKISAPKPKKDKKNPHVWSKKSSNNAVLPTFKAFDKNFWAMSIGKRLTTAEWEGLLPNCNDRSIDIRMTIPEVFLLLSKMIISLSYNFLKSNAPRINDRRKYMILSRIRRHM